VILCEGLPDSLPAGVVACTTDSRHRTPEEAAQAVQALLEPVAGVAGVRWYKKIDSTLRGYLGQEIDAMLATLDAAGGDTPAVICPAFPAQGRGLEDGYLVYAQTPPMASLPAILAQGSRRKTALVRLNQVRSGAEQLGAAMAHAYAEGARLLAVDALTDEDLGVILDAALAALPDPLLVGSAGLVGVMAKSWAQRQAWPSTARNLELALRQGPVLVVAGSGSATAHTQISTLRATPGVAAYEVHESLEIPADVTHEGSTSTIIVHLPPPSLGTPLEGAAARRACARLAEWAAALFEQAQPAALILIGGDTARQMLTTLEIRQLDVVAELLPGMPLTTARLRSGERLAVICKSGNHGDAQTLTQLVSMVNRMMGQAMDKTTFTTEDTERVER
jgi:uncharacterized protein YgbK (DUF1537 family)